MWLNGVPMMPRPMPLSPGNTWPVGNRRRGGSGLESHSGLLAGNKRRRPVMGIDGRRIDVPAESKVGREPGRDAVVVLSKRRDVPRAQMRDISRVLLK